MLRICLLGRCYFCTGPVESSRYSTGKPFIAIGMAFNENERYFYEVLVLADNLGKRLMPAGFQYSVELLRSQGVTKIITATNWTNKAFLRSVLSSWFHFAWYGVKERSFG